MQNLNILDEYRRCTNDVANSSVESAEKAIAFCEKYGAEMIILHKDGMILPYTKILKLDEKRG
jgi:hypothetical protein